MTGVVHRFADVYVVAAATLGLDPLGRPVPDDELAAAITIRGARPLARAARLGLGASLLALGSGSLPPEPDPRAAIIFATRGASLVPLAEMAHVADTEGPARVFPMAFPNTVASVHAGYLATLLRRSGPALTLCGPGAGLEALLEGALLLAGRRSDDVLVVMADESLPGRPEAWAEGAVALRLARCDGALDVSAGQSGRPPSPRLLAVAAAAHPDLLPQLTRSGPGSQAREVKGDLAAVAAVAESGVDSAVVLTGPLGVRGVASVLLATPG